MGLENKVALVTGAASEIGCAFVKYLLQNRVQVKKVDSLLCNKIKIIIKLIAGATL